MSEAGIHWLASYPKSGNTWMRIFLANLLADSAQPLCINDLGLAPIASDRTWIDEVLGFHTADLPLETAESLRPAAYDWADSDPTIRLVKIHDAYTTLTGKPLIGSSATRGAVYIIRNPLDVALSFADHYHMTVDRAIDVMGRADASLSDERRALRRQFRQRLGSWSRHVDSWLSAANLRLKVVRYEDMQSDATPTFRGVANFLGLSAQPRQIEKALEFSSFRQVAAQEAASGFDEKPQCSIRFFRSGTVGRWRHGLTSQQVDRIVRDHHRVMDQFGYLDFTEQGHRRAVASMGS